MSTTRRARQRALQWKAIDRQRLRWYHQGTRLFRARFKREGKAVVQAIIQAQTPQPGIARAILAIDDQQADWLKAMTRLYRGVSAEFGPQALNSLQRKALPRSLLDWILEESMVKVTNIEEQTKARLRQLMETSVEAGETIDDLTHRIEETYDGFATYRAYRIAATETINAMGASQTLQVSEEGDPEVEKEWLSSRDAATRDAHHVGGLDGQRVKVDEAFEIEGQRLRWPADSGLGADPSLTVNCRCTLLWYGSD